MNEEKARLAEEKKAETSIRVLCVGGVLDGQWKVVAWTERHGFKAMRPLDVGRMIREQKNADNLSVGFPEMDQYQVIGPIHFWGTKGISVALDHDTLMDKYHGDEERMMLKALLQRDVATEMGL